MKHLNSQFKAHLTKISFNSQPFSLGDVLFSASNINLLWWTFGKCW